MMISGVVIPINTPFQICVHGAERSEDARGIQKFTKSLRGGIGPVGRGDFGPRPPFDYPALTTSLGQARVFQCLAVGQDEPLTIR